MLGACPVLRTELAHTLQAGKQPRLNLLPCMLPPCSNKLSVEYWDVMGDSYKFGKLELKTVKTGGCRRHRHAPARDHVYYLPNLLGRTLPCSSVCLSGAWFSMSLGCGRGGVAQHGPRCTAAWDWVAAERPALRVCLLVHANPRHATPTRVLIRAAPLQQLARGTWELPGSSGGKPLSRTRMVLRGAKQDWSCYATGRQLARNSWAICDGQQRWPAAVTATSPEPQRVSVLIGYSSTLAARNPEEVADHRLLNAICT